MTALYFLPSLHFDRYLYINTRLVKHGTDVGRIGINISDVGPIGINTSSIKNEEQTFLRVKGEELDPTGHAGDSECAEWTMS